MKKAIRSFRYAFQGLADLFGNELNARIHAFFAVAAVAAGLFFQISATEWAIVSLCIGSVIALEAMNTALERLTDLVSPEHHPLAGRAKDAAAASVFVAAIAAAAAGLFIFLPKIWALGGG